ncbi:methyl-accepting chemotaxis protein [Geobacter sp.]|uniref:methyl-accepting chemotaxis protein n=1 Tax=Geobacter sp. TaxID=46610 RepID=UPI002612BFCA|nr:methyl-accepting chemotaxis protein [Geobacter sp.]
MPYSFLSMFRRKGEPELPVGSDAFEVLPEDSAAGRFGGWSDRLGALGERLVALNSSTEDEFLAIGARLHDFYARAGAVERMSQDVAGRIMGEDISRDMTALREILDRIAGYLAHAEQESEQSTATLTSILDLVSHVDEPLDGFKKIIKNLHMLSTAVKIESARLGEGAAGFNTLADDVERLSVSIREKSADILREKDSLAAMIEATLARVTALEAEQRSNARLILDRTRDSLATLTTIHDRCSGAAASVAACSAEIAASIATVVTSLQFHDITRQQIEHVKEALDDMRALLAASAVAPDRAAGEVADVCGLQEAQLDHAREELVAAVARVVENLRDIARKETRMSAETRVMAGSADQAGSSLFADMESGMVQVAEVLAGSARANRELAGAMAAVVASVGDIATFVTDIEEIGSEIELIALNSQVKAANTGEGGAALGVLAEAIQHLSVEARFRTGAVSEMLRKVTAVTESLCREGDRESHAIAEEIEGLVGELKGLLGSVRGMNETLLELLGRMDGEVQGLSIDIEAATGGVSVHETTNRIVGEVLGELRELVREIRRVAPASASPEREARLRELAERYTMHSERTVHASVFGGAAGGPQAFVPATVAGDDGLGDNVELF